MQRLKTRIQFQAVLAGDKVASTAHFVLHRCPLNGPPSRSGPSTPGSAVDNLLFAQSGVWLGAMVPKRWAKRAVTRNTIKRQIYNVSSDFESALPAAAHVVRLRSGFDRAHYPSATSDALKLVVREELMQLFSNASRVSKGARLPGVSR